MIATACWVLLALLHAPPAAALFSPRLIARLYGSAPGAETMVLLRHRAAMFLGFVLLCLLAAIDEASRPAAAICVGLGVASFPLVWLRGGAPAALRGIAFADLAAIPVLATALADLLVPAS